MALPRLWGAAALLLGVPALLLPCAARATTSHSLRYFYTGVSEPGQGLSQFFAVQYVDGEPIAHFDSSTRRKRPVAPWVEAVGQDDARYWDTQTRIIRKAEQMLSRSLETAGKQSGGAGAGGPSLIPPTPGLSGLHSLQGMYGCELSGDGRKGGSVQFGYDGRDFLTLDKETLAWTAADNKAQLPKWKLEAQPAIAQGFKAYLEGECVEWLRRYLDYRNESRLRTEPPEVKVTRQKSSTEGIESLVCQAHGFYPKEIKATWTRDGESWEHATFCNHVAPNLDGTYYISLYTDVEPKERGLYQCHVDHASLLQPLVLGWEQPAGNPESPFRESSVGGATLALIGLLEVMVITTITIVLIKKRQASKSTSQLQPAHSESSVDSENTQVN